jgi:hypothetical protein
MSIELARARLRGIYAIVAAAIIIVVIPFFQGTILAGTGYLTAINHITDQHDFGPYLAWVAQNQETDVIFHAIQFLAFLLIFTLPAALATILWASATRWSRIARITGQVGSGCYALAVLVGLVVSGNSAGSYADASTPALRVGIASNFAGRFAIQNILSHIAGGIMLAVWLMIIGAQLMRSSQKALPGWLGYLAVLVAALLVVTTLQFAALPAAAETSLSSLAFFALALWLLALGIYLSRLRAFPRLTAEASSGSAPNSSESTPDIDVDSSGPTLQSDGQSTLEETNR